MGACSAAAFLPFLKKKPLAAAPAPVRDDDYDPLAVPLPPAPQHHKLNGSAGTKFVSKINGKPGPGKPGHVAASDNRAGAAAKGRGIASTTKGLGTNAAAATRKPGAAAASAGLAPGKLGAAGAATAKPGAAGAAKPAALSPAQAKAEADRRRLKQLQRLTKVGLLAQDAPPEVRAKVEQAKQEVAAIQRQQELDAKRKLELEKRRQQATQQRQQQEQQRAAVLAEKQRLQAGKFGKAGLAGAAPPLGAAGARQGAGSAAVAAPGRGAGAAGQQQRAGAAGPAAAGVSRGPGSLSSGAAGAQRQPTSQQKQQHQQQQGKDPYAGLNPKQRAFLLARKREREARRGGRPGGGRGRGGGGGYGSDGEGYGGEDDEYDSEDSFIDDDESGDWRRHLRSLTGYDPSKYKDSFFDDRRMEASAAEIQAEERRSARIGRTEDEKEAEAEARRLAAKDAKKQGRKRGAAALFDD